MTLKNYKLRFLALFLLLPLVGFGPCGQSATSVSESVDTVPVDTPSDVPTTSTDLPTISIQPPAAKLDLTLVYNQATDSSVTVTGQPSATTPGNIVIIASRALDEKTDLTPRTAKNDFWQSLIANVWAENSPTPLICDQVGFACCPADSTGAFECSIKKMDAETPVWIYQYDGVRLSEAITQKIQKNLLYFGRNATDLSPSTNTLKVISEDSASDVVLNNQLNWQVDGLVENRFVKELVGGHQLQNIADNQLGLLDFNGQGSITDFSWNNQTAIINPYIKSVTQILGVSAPDNSSYKHLYYSVEEPAPTQNGRIYDLYNTPDSYNYITYLSSNDDALTDKKGNSIQTTKVNLFDVYMAQYTSQSTATFVLFEDQNGQERLRYASQHVANNDRFGGSLPLKTFTGTDGDFRKILIYDQSLDPSTLTLSDTKGLLLDAANNKAWIVKADQTNKTVTSLLKTGVTTGNNPVDMVLSEDHDKAYILNAGDDTITVVDLFVKNPPTIEKTINLKDYLPTDQINLNPTHIRYKNNTLFVTSDTLKGAIVISL